MRQHRDQPRLHEGDWDLGVSAEGRVWLLRGAPDRDIRWGSRPDTLEIALWGDFDVQDPGEEGLAALAAVVADCCRCYGLEQEDTFLHRDVSRTTCPGMQLKRYTFRRVLSRLLEAPLRTDRGFRSRPDMRNLGSCLQRCW
jgi:hypothetical protein